MAGAIAIKNLAGTVLNPTSASITLSGIADETELTATFPRGISASHFAAPVTCVYNGVDFHRWFLIDAIESVGSNGIGEVACRFAIGPNRGSTIWGNSNTMLASLRANAELESRIKPILAISYSDEDNEVIIAQTSYIARYVFLSNGAGDDGYNAVLRLRDSSGTVYQRSEDLTPLRRALSATLYGARSFGDALASLWTEWGLIARPVYSWGDAVTPTNVVPMAFAHGLDPVPATAPTIETIAYSRPFVNRMATPPRIIAPFRYSAFRRCSPVPARTSANGDILATAYTRALPTGVSLAGISFANIAGRNILRPGRTAQTPQEAAVATGATLLEATAGDLWVAWAEAERRQWQEILPHRTAAATIPGPLTAADLGNILPGSAIRIDGGGYYVLSCRINDDPPQLRAELDLSYDFP